MGKQLYVFAYDIAVDRNRTKFATLLEEEGGDRINLSVFECMLSKARRDWLLREAQELIDPETDQLACYQVCRTCYGKSVYMPEWEAPDAGESIRTV